MTSEKVGNGAGVAYCMMKRRRNTNSDDLSELLAAGTKEVHDKAENNVFVRDFLRGRIRKELFKFAQRALKLPATGEGLEFCHFEGIHSPKVLKQLYRNRVNELDLDAATKEKIVQEAAHAFHFNIEVFEELGEIGKTLKDEVMDTGMAVHGNMDGDINNCPYYAAQMHGGGSAYVCQMATCIFRDLTGQVLLAAWVAAMAGLAAGYLM